MTQDTTTQALNDLDAVALRARLATGSLSAVDLVTACLARIAEREPELQAWAWLDADYALEQARQLDNAYRAGQPMGPLHGLPVGLKDVIDTKGIPTEGGFVFEQGRVPSDDAWIVTRLRSAGAIIMGKTVTTEGAYLHPNKTRNPHNPNHTPGGSSQGSAAAVAAGMVPLAIGTQTGGSVVRPASFCGVVGLKPSFGLIPRTGVLMQSPTLDTLGVFARSVADCALLTEVLAGYDAADTATELRPSPHLLDMAQSDAPALPVFAFLCPPGWDRADPQMKTALLDVAKSLGAQCVTIDLPGLEDVASLRAQINFAEMAKCYDGLEQRGRALMSDMMQAALDDGRAISAPEYLAALDRRATLTAALAPIFARYDAILCPSALGPAPEGLGSTGDSIFNGLWTLAGTPAINLPAFVHDNGLPVGLQLVGRVGEDGRLLRTARWMAAYLDARSPR